MLYLKFFVSILISLVLMACSGGNEQDAIKAKAQKIIDRHIQEIGGVEAMRLVTTRVIEGTVTDDRPYKGPAHTVPFTFYADNAGNWRFISSQETYGCDEEGGWRLDSMGVHADAYRPRSKLGFVFDPGGFVNLDKYFKDISFGRSMMMNYRKMDGIYNDRDLTYYALWFDRETGILGQIGYHWNVKDYRDVNGVLVAHLIEAGRKGGAIIYQADTIYQNIDIPDSLLQRPR